MSGFTDRPTITSCVEYISSAKYSRTSHDENIIILAAKIGVLQTSILAGICNHIPVNFPKRKHYIQEMFNALSGQTINVDDIEDHIYIFRVQ